MQETSEGSFIASLEPLRGALRVHCYRMLGSSHDGDDIVQETMLRAWRSRDTLRDPAMVRPWLYRIATNSCLDELKRRPRRTLASETHPAADPRQPVAPPVEEPVWLEPMPDTWLATAEPADPAARYTLKESVALAFVAAIQCLTAPQRATLLLRDVVGLSAEETAQALGIGVGAANSALFRAREAIEERIGRHDPAPLEDRTNVDEVLLARYMKAFEAKDADAFVALLHEDVSTRMPPSPTWIFGRADNIVFYKHLFNSGRTANLRVTRTAANGQPALAFYRSPGNREPFALHAIQVLALRDGLIAEVDHFMTKECFPVFDLPTERPFASFRS